MSTKGLERRRKLLAQEVANLVDLSFARRPTWLQLRTEIADLKPRLATWIFRFCSEGETELAQRLYDAVPLILEAERVAGELEEKEAFSHVREGLS
jgi:hypothetical protein